MNVKKMLNDRADSYSRDATTLRQDGRPDEAIIYRTIALELRRVADEIEDDER